jgi:hypothetical protein
MSAPKTSISKHRGKVTRQMKRNATMHVKGKGAFNGYSKEVKVLDFITSKARRLPPLIDTKTKEPFDHVEIVKKIYMESGLEGVNDYLHACRNIYRRDKGKSFWSRTWGRFAIFVGRKTGFTVPFMFALFIIAGCSGLPLPAPGVITWSALIVIGVFFLALTGTIILMRQIVRTLRDMDRIFKSRDENI